MGLQNQLDLFRVVQIGLLTVLASGASSLQNQGGYFLDR